MASAGEHRKRRSGAQASDVRERLLAAGEATLQEKGFFDASARAVAERAGVAVGGVHYHFASVEDLLLESFDRSNTRRLEEYRDLARSSDGLTELLAATAAAFEEDRAQGRFRMLAQMMAAASGGGALADAIAERTEPWVALTEQTITDKLGAELLGVLRARDVAVGVVALFIGLELLDDIAPERFDTDGLLERASQLVALFANLTGGAPDDAG